MPNGDWLRVSAYVSVFLTSTVFGNGAPILRAWLRLSLKGGRIIVCQLLCKRKAAAQIRCGFL